MTETTEKSAKKRSTKTASPASSPWSVRGVSHEVRNAASMAARRAGKSLGEWLEGVVMVAAHEALKGNAVPASTNEDTLKAILAQLEKRDTAIAEIAARVEALDQRKGWIARMLGR